MLSFAIWCLLGGFAGWYFGVRTRLDAPREIRRNIVVGVIGGISGGSLLHRIVAPATLSAESVLTAFAGAIVLLAFGNWFLRPGGA